MILAALLSLYSLLLGFALAPLVIRYCGHLHRLVRLRIPIARSLIPTSRPGF
jgi:hypothetical protein